MQLCATYALQASVIAQSQAFIAYAKTDRSFLVEAGDRSSLEGRVFPFFRDINFDADIDEKSYLRWHEAQNYVAAGLQIPERLQQFMNGPNG